MEKGREQAFSKTIGSISLWVVGSFGCSAHAGSHLPCSSVLISAWPAFKHQRLSSTWDQHEAFADERPLRRGRLLVNCDDEQLRASHIGSMMGIEDKMNNLSTKDILNKSSTADRLNKLTETMSSTLRSPHASVNA